MKCGNIATQTNEHFRLTYLSGLSKLTITKDVNMRPLNLLFVFCLANSAIAADVSPKTIIKYLNDKSVKTVITDIKPIILTGNEQAYLASAEYPDQGRNFVNGYVLYRPSQKKAMRIEGYGGQSNKIVGIYSYDPSVAHIESAGSGQGYFTTVHNLVTFDGWNVKELYSAKDENNSGNCGISEQLDKCYDSETLISYSEILSTPNTHYIVVTNINQTGPETDAMESTYKTELIKINAK